MHSRPSSSCSSPSADSAPTTDNKCSSSRSSSCYCYSSSTHRPCTSLIVPRNAIDYVFVLYQYAVYLVPSSSLVPALFPPVVSSLLISSSPCIAYISALSLASLLLPSILSASSRFTTMYVHPPSPNHHPLPVSSPSPTTPSRLVSSHRFTRPAPANSSVPTVHRSPTHPMFGVLHSYLISSS